MTDPNVVDISRKEEKKKLKEEGKKQQKKIQEEEEERKADKKKMKKEKKEKDQATEPANDGHTAEQPYPQLKRDAPAEERSEDAPSQRGEKRRKRDQEPAPSVEAPVGMNSSGSSNTNNNGTNGSCSADAIVNMDVVVEGGSSVNPITSFAAFPWDRFADYLVHKSGFKAPSAIQAFSWAALLRGDDLIAIADTGSGKTLGFLAPLLSQICGHGSSAATHAEKSGRQSSNANKKKRPVRVVILAPTRELAQQIAQVAEPLCAVDPDRLAVQCVVGGLSRVDQVRAIRETSPSVVVATPGRLVDLLESSEIDLSSVDAMVLDEADRMLDMGFEASIRAIFSAVVRSEARRTCMFSATWPVEVQRLASEFLRQGHLTHLKAGNAAKVDGGTANAAVVQEVVLCPRPFDRKRILKDILQKQLPKDYHAPETPFRVLIFMLYKKTCQRMYEDLWADGYYACCLNGDMAQAARNQTMGDFKSGKYPILVATDVAARGLDVKDIRMVINVEMPLVMEDYVHRVGRTGRAGAVGRALTVFCEEEDKQHAQDLWRILKESDQKVSKEFEEVARRAPPPRRMQKKQDPFSLGHIDIEKGATGAAFSSTGSVHGGSGAKKVYFD